MISNSKSWTKRENLFVKLKIIIVMGRKTDKAKTIAEGAVTVATVAMAVGKAAIEVIKVLSKDKK